MPLGGVPALTQPYGAALGIQEPFSLPNPAAGANATFVVDGRGLRRLTSIVFTLTTSAAAANRYAHISFLGGDGLAYCVNAAAVVVTANSTQRFAGQLSRTVGEWAANTDVLFPLANVFVNPGDSIIVRVTGIDVGDTLTSIRGVMERFPLDWYDLPERNA